MNEQLKKQTIALFGEVFTVVSDEPTERLVHAARYLNECMAQYAGHVDDKQRMIVLCSLHAALEIDRLKQELEQIKQKEQALSRLMEFDESTPSSS